MSRPAPLDTAELPLADLDTSAAVRRRRLDSQRVRRRRLLLADLGIGAALGLLCLILTPGLAIAVLVVLAVLAVWGITAVARVVRGRRRRSRGAAVLRGRSAPRRLSHDAWREP